jgi:hypothetical protein
MALSANKFDNYKPSKGNRRSYPVVADDHIYRGALLMIDAAGYAAPASDTASTFCLGVALDEVDNTGGSAGDKEVLVDIGGALIKVAHEDGSLTIENRGDPVVLEDDDEVTSVGTGTNDIPAGVIDEVVDADTVWVKLRGYGILS